jgi:hypothetical protein
MAGMGRAKTFLVVSFMICALALAPFALPVTMIVRWVRGRSTKTEQIAPETTRSRIGPS